MRKLLVLVMLGVALMTAPAVAAVNLGLPPATPVNFDGNGVFDQSVPGSFDQFGPLPATVGTELFGAGTISGVASTADYGSPLWVPTDAGSDFEMTFVFWNAVVINSTRTFLDLNGDTFTDTVMITSAYADGARLMLVQDESGDFTNAAGAGAFDLIDGEFPTAYTLEDSGYNSDLAPDAGSMFAVGNDTDEEVFLDLALSGNMSALFFNVATGGFTGGSFSAQFVDILGGAGANQFYQDLFGPEGSADALIVAFDPTVNWAFGGDIDIQLSTVPEPATLVFLGTGLASLIGYRLRRRMVA